MRILEFFGMIPPEYGGRHTGGADFTVWEISRGLARKGHEVFMDTTLPYKGGIFEGVRVINQVSIHKNISSKIGISPNECVINIGKRYGFDPDMVFDASLHYNILYRYTGFIIEKIKPDIIHTHGITLDRLPIIDAVISSEEPALLTLHGLLGLEPYSGASNIPKDDHARFEYEKFVIHKALKKKNLLLSVVSSTLKDELVKKYDVPEERIVVINNGVDEKFFNPSSQDKCKLREMFKMPCDKLIFLTVGSYTPRKNQILVLRALKKLREDYSDVFKNILYISVGSGPIFSNLVEYVKSEGLEENVVISGPLFGQRLVDMYWASDFFILTSLREAFGLVFLEAMAAGLPVVTMARLEGVRDIYVEGAFVLIDKYTEDEVERMMIYASNREWDRDSIRDYAKKFLWDNIVDEYLKVFEYLVKGRGS